MRIKIYIADVIQLKSSYTACLLFKQTLNKAGCGVQETAVRTNFIHEKLRRKPNYTTLVFRMVHGTNGLHVVRIVNGTNSLVIIYSALLTCYHGLTLMASNSQAAEQCVCISADFTAL